MLRKFSAASLIVLALSPFTAPFSTCDLSTLLGHAGTHGVPLAPRSKTALTTDSSVSTVPSAITRTARAKTLVTTSRHTICLVGHEPSAHGRPDDSVHRLAIRSVLTTILRL
jgi:hypothetical protein